VLCINNKYNPFNVFFVWYMKWRVPDPEINQRGLNERLCKKTVMHVNLRADAMNHSRWRKLIKDG